jgi:hypothetical protein
MVVVSRVDPQRGADALARLVARGVLIAADPAGAGSGDGDE